MSGSNTVSLVVNASIAAELLSPECKAPTSRMPFLVHDVPCDDECPRASYDKIMDGFFRFYGRILLPTIRPSDVCVLMTNHLLLNGSLFTRDSAVALLEIVTNQTLSQKPQVSPVHHMHFHVQLAPSTSNGSGASSAASAPSSQPEPSLQVKKERNVGGFTNAPLAAVLSTPTTSASP